MHFGNRKLELQVEGRRNRLLEEITARINFREGGENARGVSGVGPKCRCSASYFE